jgi:hypothetical protein
MISHRTEVSERQPTQVEHDGATAGHRKDVLVRYRRTSAARRLRPVWEQVPSCELLMGLPFGIREIGTVSPYRCRNLIRNLGSHRTQRPKVGSGILGADEAARHPSHGIHSSLNPGTSMPPEGTVLVGEDDAGEPTPRR